VPSGGPFDTISAELANGLFGNPPDACVLELGLAAVRLVAEAPVRLSVVGASAPMLLDGRPAPVQASYALEPGQVVDLRPPTVGARVYLGAPGGWKRKGPVARGVLLEPNDRSKSMPPLQLADPPTSLHRGPIRVMQGPQHALSGPWLEGAGPEGAWLESTWPRGVILRVGLRSDRVGVRLEGLQGMELPELASEPAVPGAVQATPGGELVVLGPDGPTLGGYPKPAVVVTADLSRIGQLRPGDEVEFSWVEADQALDLLREQSERLARLRGWIGIRCQGASG
jgi:allophanate hydrolase subunit 2